MIPYSSQKRPCILTEALIILFGQYKKREEDANTNKWVNGVPESWEWRIYKLEHAI